MKFLKKSLFTLLALSILLLPFSADANRTIFKNRTIPPHFLESAPIASDIQTFLATGTWYRKPGVEYVLVILAASGGGGGSSGGANAGGGGQGGECKTEIVDVRGTTSETVTIGGGGAGGVAGNGTAGAASSFGALVTCVGGHEGLQNSTADTQWSNQNAVPLVGAGLGGADSYAGSKGAYGAGGVGGGGGTLGGGGGGSYGAGGAGGGAGASGVAAAANTGGGGGGASQAAGNGGAGGSGICIVISLSRSITLP